jgi:hypothetical protein
MTGFHPGGRLRLCWLEEDETIDDVPCARSTIPGEMWRGILGRDKSGVTFHPDGRLQGCRLSRDLTLAGRRHEAGSRIEFDPAGHAIVPDREPEPAQP